MSFRRGVLGLCMMGLGLGIAMGDGQIASTMEGGGTQVATGPARTMQGATGTGPATVTRAESAFFEVKARGLRVVYIVDHSGSMIDLVDSAKAALGRSMEELRPDMKVGVVTVSESAELLLEDDEAVERAKKTGRWLADATAEYKLKMAKAIERVKWQGKNDDMLEPFQSAFELALRQKPDVIVFLTDGLMSDRVGEVVKRMNRERKAKVHVISFAKPEGEEEKRLQELAEENGGTYRFVAERELRK